MRLLISSAVLGLFLAFSAPQSTEAPTGFDNKSNGVADDATHQADQTKFDEVEQLSDGLGPLYNAQSCRECHQSPVSGAASQVTELRVGHQGPDGHFRNPEIPIAHGTEVIAGRSLVNDRAICPNAAFPNNEIQERVPETETIRTFRISLNLSGDGFVEAVADQTLIDLAQQQCKSSHRKLCGQVLQVPIVEAPGQMSVGRFGWKDEHASLLSFAADAYLNEMGITNRLQPDEVTKLCNTASEPNDTPGPDGLSDIDHFARFVRATKAPARDSELANSAVAKRGNGLFAKIGCATCHVEMLTTAPAGTKINDDIENFGYHSDGLTFIVHNGAHPYLYCLVGEKATKALWDKAGKGITAFQQQFGRGKGGRPTTNVGLKKTILEALKQPGRKKEKAVQLMSDIATASGQSYISRVGKSDRERDARIAKLKQQFDSE